MRRPCLGARRLAALCCLALSPLLFSRSCSASSQAEGGEAVFRAPSPALTEAERLMRVRQFAQAEAVLREVLRTQESNADALYDLADCLLRENKPAAALQQYTTAAAKRSPTAEELIQVGQAYVLLNDDADADKWTLNAVRLDPANPQAWYSLGRIRYTDQKFTDAAACFKKALQLSPQNVKAENNLGLAYEGQNRTDDAVAAYRLAIAWQNAQPVAQRSEQPLLNLAIILLHRSDLVQAEPLLTQAVAIAPDNPRVHEQLGHLYLQGTKFAPAAAQFEKAILEDPRNSGLHFLLGQAYRHLGRMGEAQAQFDTAAHLADPANAPSSH